MPRSYSRQSQPEGFSRVKHRSAAESSARKAKLSSATAKVAEKNKSLPASELRFRMLMDNAPVLVRVSDTQKQCTWFNKPWLEFTGRRLEEEMGEGWADNVHPDDLERSFTIYTVSFDERTPFEMTYRLRRHDGEYRWMLDKGTPLHGPAHEFIGYVGSCVDITEQLLTQKELEKRVAERTAELVAANKELTAQMDERARLENTLLNISEQEQRRLGQDLHDGLCQSLSGLAFMARSLAKTLEAQELAGPSAEAARLADLIHESMEQSRSIAKGLHPVVMDAEGLMSALHELVARSSGSISCRMRCERMVPITDNGVALHLYRIAQEAVANALKHSRARSITLSLRLRQSLLSLSVADDGCGLPEVIPLSEGMGLRLMKYRADVIGADFSIGKRKGHGTRMTCLLRMPGAGPPMTPALPNTPHRLHR